MPSSNFHSARGEVSFGSVPMTPERWRAIDAVIQGALAREPSEREAWIANACAGDDALRREVVSLLGAHDRADGDFLERPAADSPDAPQSLTPPVRRLATALEGRYTIERELAQGGMATVYLARDLRHGRQVAIKVLREELAAAVGAERFLAEIRVTASLKHPHILPLFDSGDAGGLLWYAMPYIEGETLRTRLAREGSLPVDAALKVAGEMADALEHAHRHGVVHRDVKPENVLLQDGHALVADFGIALALEQAGDDRLTRTGVRIGTPQYMAPEQAQGNRPIDARADVYALGAVLHEMLAGESLHKALPQAALARAPQARAPHGRHASLASRRPELPPFIDAAVWRALQPRPEDRFPSAAAFSAALAGAADDHSSGAAWTPVDEAHAVPMPGRLVSARGAVNAAFFMLVVGLTGGWLVARSSRVEQKTASATEVPAPAISSADRVGGAPGEAVLTVVDRAGRLERTIPAIRPWTPRFSPDGRYVAFGAFDGSRKSSDIWVTDLAGTTTTRLTDDGGDSNDPQWSADGAKLAYSVNAPAGKDLYMRTLGDAPPQVLAARRGTQFASDWLRDGSALLVTEQTDRRKRDILIQPGDGSSAYPFAATAADEAAARVSPDGAWIAYTSDESGRLEVYIDSYRSPGHRTLVSLGGGTDPVWRGDGRELYYWSDGVLMAAQLRLPVSGIPVLGARQQLFRAAYVGGPNTMYDVSPDGERFVIVEGR